MASENPDRHDEQQPTGAAHHPPEEDLQMTQRIAKESDKEPEPDGEAEQPEKPRLLDSFRKAYTQARDGRKPSANTQKQDRNAKGRDRSKGLMAIAAAGILMFFVFIAMFSHSTNRESEARRNEPSLGRPEQLPEQNKSGSAVPLQSADISGQDNNNDEVSPDDLNNMAKRSRPEPPKTIAGVPPMDPTLEAYRQARDGIGPPPPPPPPAPTRAAAPAPAHNEADDLKNSSLVFVRNATGTSTQATLQPASYSPEPALLERRNSGLLPNGSRLVARLQAVASTAVKTPVVASIEYNYERDGEIIIPAGTKAFGELQQADRQGIVSVHFHTLQMPDGTVQKIDGTAMSLDYGPLKGSVSGSNRAKRVLVRSLTGVGEIAAFLVGGPGGFGASQALDNSILLRERIASNAGLAGEQEVTSLATNEQIVVTVAANTRFFIVLVDSSNPDRSPRLTPTGGQREKTQIAAVGSALPSAQELQELVDLKSELNRMYQQVGATRTSEPATASGQQQQQ